MMEGGMGLRGGMEDGQRLEYDLDGDVPDAGIEVENLLRKKKGLKRRILGTKRGTWSVMG
jgi:hypothetical protein